MTVGISYGISVQNDSKMSITPDESKSAVFTMEIEEIGVSYSDDAVNWQTLILDIEKKQCEYLIVLLGRTEVPEQIKGLNIYKDLEIEIIKDESLDEDLIKLIEVK